jgi:hypothetical protein
LVALKQAEDRAAGRERERLAPKKYGDKVQLGSTGGGSGAISISWLATEDGFGGGD